MKLSVYENNNLTIETTVGNNPESFYMGVGKCLVEHYEPLLKQNDNLDVDIKTSKGNAKYTMTKSKYSLRVFEVENNIDFDKKLDFKDNYHLEMINAEQNAYKYYDLSKIGDNQVTAKWGRISPRSEANLRTPYSYEEAYLKLGEKLAKGYIDMSFKYNEKAIANKKDSVNVNSNPVGYFNDKTVSQKLYHQLLSFSKKVVKKTYQSDVIITETMVRKATRLFNKLTKQSNVESFNNILQQIMLLAPRKIDFKIGESVQEYMAESVDDFDEIIDREETILNSLQVINVSNKNRKSGIVTQDFNTNIHVELATDEDRQKVINRLNYSLQGMVKNVYKITDDIKNKNFDDYCKENSIKKIKKLWHGSVNANWLSIITNGLSLRVRVANGSMFGHGIYFAPSSKKSWGYTSYSGSYWARGNSSTAFMGLYDTAYGIPEKTYYSHQYTENELKSLNKNCVHALKGQQLYNDEIIFFNENAIVLRYLVEFN